MGTNEVAAEVATFRVGLYLVILGRKKRKRRGKTTKIVLFLHGFSPKNAPF